MSTEEVGEGVAFHSFGFFELIKTCISHDSSSRLHNALSTHSRMPHHAPVFQIEDDDNECGHDDDDDLADPMPGTADQAKSPLIDDTAERVVGTAGCCGAFVMLFGCLCCGLCTHEFVETYRHHTLCGRWCPV